MFVTIILTAFHMLSLHLFVQDGVLQVFLLKCEITFSSVSSKQTWCDCLLLKRPATFFSHFSSVLFNQRM